MSPGIFQKAEEAAASIRKQIVVSPRVGVVLGSGLGSFADQVQQPVSIAYQEIPHFPRPTVKGHSGRLVGGHESSHIREFCERGRALPVSHAGYRGRELFSRDAVCMGMKSEDDVDGGGLLHARRTQTDGADAVGRPFG